MELWTTRTPEVGTVEQQAARAEQAGWHGITFTDSQNLVGDPYVAVALAARATGTLKLGTGVTNLFTRHPAALANVAVTVQEESGGRFVLGTGRGDTALFHLGRKPMPVAQFADRLRQVQAYLSGGTVLLGDTGFLEDKALLKDKALLNDTADRNAPSLSGNTTELSGNNPDQEGHESRLLWLDRTRQAKVPLDVAASGPRVIELAAQVADSITFAVGADPARLRWALDLARKAAAEAGRDPGSLRYGAYINVGCHPDPETARALIAGGVAAFAHFSAMPGSTGAGLDESDRRIVAEVGQRYDSNVHLRNDAEHTDALDPDFVDRFAVVGPPDHCVERVAGLAALGLERFVVTGPTFGGAQGTRDDGRTANRLLRDEVLPALLDLREGTGT